SGASSSTSRIRIGYSSGLWFEGNRARSMCFIRKLGSSVVVIACRGAAALRRVVHVDADAASVVHHLDPVDAAPVGLHALGVDHPAAGGALDPAHGVGHGIVAAALLALFGPRPRLGPHRPRLRSRAHPVPLAHCGAVTAVAPLLLATIALATVAAPILRPGPRAHRQRQRCGCDQGKDPADGHGGRNSGKRTWARSTGTMILGRPR